MQTLLKSSIYDLEVTHAESREKLSTITGHCSEIRVVAKFKLFLVVSNFSLVNSVSLSNYT